MNLFKKSTATVALVALLSGVFSAGVSASSSTEIEAANALADNGVITDHSDDTAAYNLNQNVLRQEIAAVARGIAGLDKKTTCDESFTDVTATTPNDWACYSVEALLDADLIASNTMFKPEMEISKAEAVGMMVKAAFGDEYAYDAGLATSWMEQVVAFAVDKGVVKNFTNYDTAATRGFVFEAGSEALIMASDEVVEECDEVSQLLGLCDEVADDNGDDEGGDDVVVISGDNLLMAELSADTPAGADLPQWATGVEILKFDVTAGSEDVSITAVELERVGFGESSADKVAVYTEEWRASKAKSFNDSDDVANVTFSPAVVVKAGATRTLIVKVNTDASEQGEFAISVANITASSTVDAATIVSDYFDVKSGVTAAELEFDFQGVNTSVKAGEEQAELAEFKLTNNGAGTTDIDIMLTSITLEENGTIDEEDVLENFTLTVDWEVIATVASIEDKYLTFNFDAFLLEDDKNETFTVKADVMGGAGETVVFDLDNVIDVTATASKYNAVSVVRALWDTSESVNVDAGELTLYAIDAETDEIREDKDNVVLGQVKIVNVAGQNLELLNVGFDLELTNALGGEGLQDYIDNVEFEANGTSYELDADGTGTIVNYSDTDLDIVLPQGTTIITVRADTLEGLEEGAKISMDLTVDNANFYVEETEDDVQVTEISPSALSFDAVEVIHSAATISDETLANVKVVKWATDLVALQFDIEAWNASYVVIDEINVHLESSGSTVDLDDDIAEVALYQGSVSESNLLDKVAGSKISAAGDVDFDWFDIEIAADATETFIVTVSTVDTTAVVDKVITAVIFNPSLDIMLEDDEWDSVSLTETNPVWAKEITVLDFGKLVLTWDVDNTDNEDSKVVLAGESEIVFSIDAKATNEEVNAETVTFALSGTLSDTGSLKNVVDTAKLYLDDTVVATADSWDMVASIVGAGTATGELTFENIDNLDFTINSAELRLEITFETSGYEKIGISISDVTVTDVTVTDAEWVDSGEDVTTLYKDDSGSAEAAALTATQSNTFEVVPVKVVASGTNEFATDDTTASITFAVDSGNNTDADGNDLSADLTDVVLHAELINSTWSIVLKNDKGETVATGSVVSLVDQDVTLTSVAWESISSGEVYTLTTNAEATFELNKDWVNYEVDTVPYSMKLQGPETLGTYASSN